MENPMVTLDEGRIRGIVSKDFLGGTFYSFLGIPYAKAPIGALRFKAPSPVEPWQGVKDATKEGPPCPSKHMIFQYFLGSEDNCLNLNVFTKQLPTNTSVSLRPVMVWIHGGGFLHGSNGVEMYSPDYLITEDIVLVSINYRLGVFGFLSLEDESLGVPGNNGLKDMVLALQWVQRNIKNFCGDPNNVTIFGESAGSASVQYLYLSPMARGLFHKAIAQSGSCLNNWSRGCSNGLIIAENLGYEETDEKKILEYLRKLPAHKIVKAQHNTPDSLTPKSVRPFGPVVEKNNKESAFLSQEPVDIIKAGTFNQVPLIMGYASREGMLFAAIEQMQKLAGFTVTTNIENEIFPDANVQIGSEESLKIAADIKKFYFGEEEPSGDNIDKLHLLKTDNAFLYGIHKSVSHQKLVNRAPIYFYKMTLVSSLNYFKNLCSTKHIYIFIVLSFLIKNSGDGMVKNMLTRILKSVPTRPQDATCHADDVAYLFKMFCNEDIKPGSAEETYITRFIKMWANFARTGNPTPDENDPLLKVQWLPVTKEENRLLEIGSELRMRNDPDLERMKFWSHICRENVDNKT